MHLAEEDEEAREGEKNMKLTVIVSLLSLVNLSSDPERHKVF